MATARSINTNKINIKQCSERLLSSESGHWFTPLICLLPTHSGRSARYIFLPHFGDFCAPAFPFPHIKLEWTTTFGYEYFRIQVQGCTLFLFILNYGVVPRRRKSSNNKIIYTVKAIPAKNRYIMKLLSGSVISN